MSEFQEEHYKKMHTAVNRMRTRRKEMEWKLTGDFKQSLQSRMSHFSTRIKPSLGSGQYKNQGNVYFPKKTKP